MANTTNFGWETPDDTDLVKDGAAAIRTLGNSIDTSMVDLKGGTTGQVLSKNSNTDMDFTWVAQDDSNAIQNAIVDAKGDLIAASGADTPARLAVGTNEHRLVADSAQTTGLKYVADTTNYAIAAKGDLLVGTAADTLQALTVGTNGYTLVADSSTATGLKWEAASSGGMTLLASGSLSGATVSIGSISGSYVDLVLYVYDTNTDIQFDDNNGGNFDGLVIESAANNAAANTVSQLNTGTLYLGYNAVGTTDNSHILRYFNYAQSGIKKLYWGMAAGGNLAYSAQWSSRGTGAITSVDIVAGTGTFSAGSYKLYGVK